MCYNKYYQIPPIVSMPSARRSDPNQKARCNLLSGTWSLLECEKAGLSTQKISRVVFWLFCLCLPPNKGIFLPPLLWIQRLATWFFLGDGQWRKWKKWMKMGKAREENQTVSSSPFLGSSCVLPHLQPLTRKPLHTAFLLGLSKCPSLALWALFSWCDGFLLLLVSGRLLHHTLLYF